MENIYDKIFYRDTTGKIEVTTMKVIWQHVLMPHRPDGQVAG
jgi:hypothetical protein